MFAVCFAQDITSFFVREHCCLSSLLQLIGLQGVTGATRCWQSLLLAATADSSDRCYTCMRQASEVLEIAVLPAVVSLQLRFLSSRGRVWQGLPANAVLCLRIVWQQAVGRWGHAPVHHLFMYYDIVN